MVRDVVWAGGVPPASKRPAGRPSPAEAIPDPLYPCASEVCAETGQRRRELQRNAWPAVSLRWCEQQAPGFGIQAAGFYCPGCRGWRGMGPSGESLADVLARADG